MAGKDKPYRFRWADAVIESTLSSMTKLVLLILATYMNKHGTNCWPGYTRIARNTSLSRSTVIKHINIAVQLGWLVKKHRYTNQGDQTSNQYLPRIPEGSTARRPPSHSNQPPSPQTNNTVVAINDPNNRINPLTNKKDISVNSEEYRQQLREMIGNK